MMKFGIAILITFIFILLYRPVVAQEKLYEQVKEIEYHKQIDFSSTNFDSLLSQVNEEDASHMKKVKRLQEEKIKTDTSSFVSVTYKGVVPELFEIIFKGDTIRKNHQDFEEGYDPYCGTPSGKVCEILKVPRIKGNEKSFTEADCTVIIRWVERNLFAALVLDFSYSKVRIEGWFDVELATKIGTRGRDKNGLPIPYEVSEKIPDQVIVWHSNW